MAKLRRRARTAAKWASTVLPILVTTAWFLSGWWRAELSFHRTHSFVTCTAEAGRLTISVLHEVAYPLPIDLKWEIVRRGRLVSEQELWFTDYFRPPPTVRWYWWGQWDKVVVPGVPTWSDIVDIPLWPLVLVVAGPAMLMWPRDVVAWRRRRRGLCPTCGYDRRGLATDVPCPECGKN